MTDANKIREAKTVARCDKCDWYQIASHLSGETVCTNCNRKMETLKGDSERHTAAIIAIQKFAKAYFTDPVVRAAIMTAEHGGLSQVNALRLVIGVMADRHKELVDQQMKSYFNSDSARSSLPS